MFGNKNIAIGLDIGSYAVKAVVLQPNKGRLTLQGYAQQRIGADDPSEVVRRVMHQLGFKHRNIISAVSGRSVIVRQVETPRLTGNELRSHITYEADKYIPFGADEVVIDCQPLPSVGEEDDNTQQVQLVAVRRGFIEDHVGMLNRANMHPKVIDVDMFALCNAYEALGPAMPIDSEAPVTALVDIGASKVCVAIVRGNRPLFTREFYLAGNEITDAICRSFGESPEDVEIIKLAPGEALEALIDAAMPSLEDLANEIRLSFDYVEGQFDMEVEQVVLAGGSSQLSTLGDIIGNLLGRPVVVFDPLAGLDLMPARYDINSLDGNAPGLTVALGLACHLAAQGISGLGGSQVASWQSRYHGGVTAAGTAMAMAGESDEISQDTVAADLSDEDAAMMPPPVEDLPPPPAAEPAFAAPDMPPPPEEQASFELPLPGSDEYEAEPAAELAPPTTPSGEEEEGGYNRGHSSVLVILDEDDDEMMPRTSDIVRKSGSHSKSDSRQVDLESFSEEEDDDSDLPPLP
ncbi:MAG: type IV pilus assembly protein PilM [Planctomycetota bacterium]